MKPIKITLDRASQYWGKPNRYECHIFINVDLSKKDLKEFWGKEMTIELLTELINKRV
jgi:hypothetical protein